MPIKAEKCKFWIFLCRVVSLEKMSIFLTEIKNIKTTKQMFQIRQSSCTSCYDKRNKKKFTSM